MVVKCDDGGSPPEAVEAIWPTLRGTCVLTIAAFKMTAATERSALSLHDSAAKPFEIPARDAALMRHS
jgi:hypothetical protein